MRQLLLIFLVSSPEDFLFISFQQKNEMKKGKYPDGFQIFTSLLEYQFVYVTDLKRNLSDSNFD